MVDHPDEWIGIPEQFPNSRWDTAYEWASDLVGALASDWGAALDDGEVVLRDLLVSLANSLDRTIASRLYVSLGRWSGPVVIAALALAPASDFPGMSAAQVAGSEDVDVIQQPIVDEFVTNSGVTGATCVRYFRRDDPDRIVARADFVVPVGDGFATVFHEDADLPDFQAALPLVQALAKTITGER
jgi:hypothetical protein